jgi:hypothetical protein
MADRGQLPKDVENKLATFAEARQQAPDDHIELEARLGLNTAEIVELVRGLESAEVPQTAVSIVQVGNVLRRDPHNNYIQKVRWVVQTKPVAFAGSTTGRREFLQKEVLGETIRVHTQHVWRLSTSREHKIPKFDLTGLDLLTRLKVRLEYLPPDWPNWRLDITLTWQAPGPQEVAKLLDIQREKLGDLLAAKNRKEFVGTFLHKLQEASALFRGSVELEWIGASLPRTADLGVVDLVLRRAIKADTAAETDYAVVVEKVAELVCRDAAARARRGLKGVLPTATPLTWATYAELNSGQPLKGWLVSAKAEGFQCVVVCGEIVEVAHEAAGKTVWRPPCTPRRERRLTIIEGEYIPATEKTEARVYAFDVLMFDGNSLMRQRPSDRATRVAEAVAAVQQACGKTDASSWLQVLPQQTLPHTPPRAGADPDIERIIRGARTTPFPNDGLIFTHPDAAPYDCTRRYKWKPAEECSIDFWLHEIPRPQWVDEFNPARIAGERADGSWGVLGPQFEGAVYALMVTANAHIAQSRMLTESPIYSRLPAAARAARESQRQTSRQMQAFPALFEPPDHPQAHVLAVPRGQPGGDGEFSHEVCELRPRFRTVTGDLVERWTAGAALTPDWEFVRVRTDRRAIIAEGYYGNYFPFAEDTWYAAKAPFPMAALWGGAVPERAPELFAGAPAAFVSFVKARLYRHLAGSRTHVELAASANDDVGTVYSNAPERVLFIAQHSADLLQILQRVNGLNKPRNSRADQRIRVAAALAHLAAPTDDVLGLIQQLDFPPATSLAAHFAISAVCGSAKDLANFAATCSSLAAADAQLIAVFLDGEAVQRHAKEPWAQTDKYSLVFANRTGKLSPHGQKVIVRADGRSTEEFVVNFPVVAAAMTKAGFRVELSKMFAEFLPDFTRENRDAFSQLTDIDREFIGSLYRAVVWRKHN